MKILAAQYGIELFGRPLLVLEDRADSKSWLRPTGYVELRRVSGLRRSVSRRGLIFSFNFFVPSLLVLPVILFTWSSINFLSCLLFFLPHHLLVLS